MAVIKNYIIAALTVVIIVLLAKLSYIKKEETQELKAPVFQFELAGINEDQHSHEDFYELASVSKTYINLYKNEIKKAAKKWDVPASAIAGIICAESSLNFDGAHRLEEYYFKNYILTKDDKQIKELIEEAQIAQLYNNRKSFFSKIHNPGNWSLGLCQMQICVGLFTDSLMASLEQRHPYAERELITRLLNPATNIDYCACYLSYITTLYLSELDMDLRQRPSLLVTIYNIGNINELIEKRKNTLTRSVYSLVNNQFGRFIENNRKKIDSLIYETNNEANMSLL